MIDGVDIDDDTDVDVDEMVGVVSPALLPLKLLPRDMPVIL